MDSEPTLVVVPIVPIQVLANVELKVAVENASSRSFHFLPDNDDRSMAKLEFSLLKGDQVLESHAPTREPPLLAKRRVRELKPGERLVHTLRLDERYPSLPRGEYALRAKYIVAKESYLELNYGLTPITLERTVAYVKVE